MDIPRGAEIKWRRMMHFLTERKCRRELLISGASVCARACKLYWNKFLRGEKFAIQQNFCISRGYIVSEFNFAYEII